MNHFSVIGLNPGNNEQFNQLIKDLASISEKIIYKDYNLYFYNDKSGAQVYIHTKKSFLGKETWDSITPAFNGKAIQKIWSKGEDGFDDEEYPAYIMPNKEWPLEISLHCWVHNDEREEYPLIVDIPNYIEFRDKDISLAKGVQATLFPHQFEHYKSEEDFREKYPKKDNNPFPAPGMFVPSGTFSFSNDPNFKAHAECWCYGKVEFVETLKNEFSGLEFRHMVMDTYAAKYDVLIDSSYTEDIEVGHIIGGVFWISAKVLF